MTWHLTTLCRTWECQRSEHVTWQHSLPTLCLAPSCRLPPPVTGLAPTCCPLEGGFQAPFPDPAPPLHSQALTSSVHLLQTGVPANHLFLLSWAYHLSKESLWSSLLAKASILLPYLLDDPLEAEMLIRSFEGVFLVWCCISLLGQLVSPSYHQTPLHRLRSPCPWPALRGCAGDSGPQTPTPGHCCLFSVLTGAMLSCHPSGPSLLICFCADRCSWCWGPSPGTLYQIPERSTFLPPPTQATKAEMDYHSCFVDKKKKTHN